jgi:hypothetical protein
MDDRHLLLILLLALKHLIIPGKNKEWDTDRTQQLRAHSVSRATEMERAESTSQGSTHPRRRRQEVPPHAQLVGRLSVVSPLLLSECHVRLCGDGLITLKSDAVGVFLVNVIFGVGVPSPSHRRSSHLRGRQARASHSGR